MVDLRQECVMLRGVINNDVNTDAENMEEKHYNDEDTVHITIEQGKINST